jgi:hypothetical protein
MLRIDGNHTLNISLGNYTWNLTRPHEGKKAKACTCLLIRGCRRTHTRPGGPAVGPPSVKGLLPPTRTALLNLQHSVRRKFVKRRHITVVGCVYLSNSRYVLGLTIPYFGYGRPPVFSLSFPWTFSLSG